jgi:hypothetical protein
MHEVWGIRIPGGVVIITVSTKDHFLRDKIKRFLSGVRAVPCKELCKQEVEK